MTCHLHGFSHPMTFPLQYLHAHPQASPWAMPAMTCDPHGLFSIPCHLPDSLFSIGPPRAIFIILFHLVIITKNGISIVPLVFTDRVTATGCCPRGADNEVCCYGVCRRMYYRRLDYCAADTRKLGHARFCFQDSGGMIASFAWRDGQPLHELPGVVSRLMKTPWFSRELGVKLTKS